MKVPFSHQNMPGQYVFLARHLGRFGHDAGFVVLPKQFTICLAKA
jgi:hypothetical protein